LKQKVYSLHDQLVATYDNFGSDIKNHYSLYLNIYYYENDTLESYKQFLEENQALNEYYEFRNQTSTISKNLKESCGQNEK
jgi:hypothetical protein